MKYGSQQSIHGGVPNPDIAANRKLQDATVAIKARQCDPSDPP